uniref:Uncharacterized protein n=1 Tax=Romanomermis culicivorax TaxID=13658 RepID=A0A915K263_ROMCU
MPNSRCSPKNYNSARQKGQRYNETDRYRVPKYSTAISSFVVVDPDEEVAQPTNSLAQKSSLEIVDEAPTIVEIESVQEPGKVCLPKVTFLTVFIFLTGLMVAQAAGVTICLALRFKRKKKSR